MRLITTLLFLALSFSANAERVDRSMSSELSDNIHIDIIDGEIKIKGWNKKEIRVSGDVYGKRQDFVFEEHDGTIRIELSGKHGFWNRGGGSAELTINAPHTSNIVAEGASVSFKISDMRGNVRASSMSGDIELEGGVGKVDLESLSGDLTVNGASGRLNLSSVSGDIEANAEAKHFDASSVSGSIEASIGMSERIELETVSGDIEIRLGLVDDGRLEADSVSGDIEINFENEPLNASFDIETGPGGDVRNRLSEDSISKRSSFSGSLEFKLGEGDSTVKIETMSGTIKLDK